MSIFWTFLELQFSGLKSILFYPQYQKIFLFGFFGSKKKKYEKKVDFCYKNHGLTRLQNVDFFKSFLAVFFCGLKSILFYPEYKKMFLYGLFLLKKKKEIKVDFLTKTMD